jgi:hypothetical protein
MCHSLNRETKNSVVNERCRSRNIAFVAKSYLRKNLNYGSKEVIALSRNVRSAVIINMASIKWNMKEVSLS